MKHFHENLRKFYASLKENLEKNTRKYTGNLKNNLKTNKRNDEKMTEIFRKNLVRII